MPVEIAEQDLEALLLVDIHRAGFLQDRYPDDPLALGKGLNFYTGAPESADDLKKPGQIRVRGEKLQREAFFMPADMAMSHLRRPCETCDACGHGEPERCEDGPTLKHVPRSDWSDVDAANFFELESRIQAAFIRWEEQGLVVRRPPFLFTGTEEGDAGWTAKDGQDTWAAFVTPKGIAHARAFCTSETAPSWVRATVADNRRSPLWGMTQTQRANAPQWQQKEFADEGGKITEAPIQRDPSQIALRCPRCERWHTPTDPCSEAFPAPRRSTISDLIRRFFGGKKR